MKNKSFGLDIGGEATKVVWLSKEKNGFFLNAVLTSPTPPKGMLSESPLDQEEMAQVIRNLALEAKIATRNVSIALPENEVYTRVIEMPALSDKELVSAIYWEAEQYIPIPLTSVTLDYRVLSRPENSGSGEKMSVLLVGAPTQLIEKYQKVIALSGFNIASIETELLSIIRSVAIGETFPTALIVHVGTITTSLCIVHKGILTFAYTIPTGGLAISRAIAADFGFSLKQAEEYKKVYGLSNASLGGKIGAVAKPVLQSILTEMKKALAFNDEKYKEDPVKQIVLSGGTAKLPGLVTFFAQESGIETVIANPWKILTDQEVPKEIVDNASDYTIAVGLAMRE